MADEGPVPGWAKAAPNPRAPEQVRTVTTFGSARHHPLRSAAGLSRGLARRAPTNSRMFASKRIGQGVSKRITASTTVQIPSVHVMNGGV